MNRPPILDHVSLLADATRVRLLALLERQELTVSELCTVLQLPQSTVSRQLKLLVDAGWLSRRQDGTRAFYILEPSQIGPTERRMWLLLRDQALPGDTAEQDRARLDTVLVDRKQRSQEFFSSQAGEWDKLRRELWGVRFDTASLLGLLDPSWTVGDLGCGTGELTRALAPFVRRVIGVDRSEAMLQAASIRLEGLGNVDLREGDLERLPLEDDELDAATLMLVLHHVSEPARVLSEAARVLKPGGVLLISDMMPHDREEYRQQMGHVWLGFSEDAVERRLEAAGFVHVRYVPQPADPQAKGPRLFVATGRQPAPETPRALAEASVALSEEAARRR